MTRTRKLKIQEVQEDPEPEPVLPDPPPPEEEVDTHVPPPEEPPPPEPIDISSLRAEFSLRIASLVEARKSMITGYLAIVLAPMVIVLAFIALIGVPLTAGDRSLVRSLSFILTVIAVMGLPMMVASWANGLHPKGSYGRFVSGTAFAILLTIWLVFVLLESDLERAVADSGTPFQLERVLVLLCLIAAFFFGRAIFELVDDRKLWRKSMGAKVKMAPVNLKGRFLDLDPRIGRLQSGNSSALIAYARFLIVPTVLLVILERIPDALALSEGDAIEVSVGTMFGIVLLLGVVMVVMKFVRGFYPSGSLGRVVFGLLCIPVLFLFAWGILFASGIQDALEQNHFVMDMSVVAIPVSVYIMFTLVSETSELVDNRRLWHRKLGLPVKPYLHEETYRLSSDFRIRYASFVAGAVKGRGALNKFIFRRVVAILVAEALLVSSFYYLGDEAAAADFESDIRVAVDHIVMVLLLIGTVTACSVFLQWSYKKGSFARLVMSGIFCLFTVLWTYVFWSAIVDSMSTVPYMSFLVPVLTFVMYALIGWAGIRALLALRTYSKNRETYLNWRLLMLHGDASFGTPQQVSGVSASVKAFLGDL